MSPFHLPSHDPASHPLTHRRTLFDCLACPGVRSPESGVRSTGNFMFGLHSRVSLAKSSSPLLPVSVRYSTSSSCWALLGKFYCLNVHLAFASRQLNTLDEGFVTGKGKTRLTKRWRGAWEESFYWGWCEVKANAFSLISGSMISNFSFEFPCTCRILNISAIWQRHRKRQRHTNRQR